MKPKYVEMKDIKGEKCDEASQRWWAYSQGCGNSPISDIFGGQFFTETFCKKCSHRSWTFDEFLDVSLEIPSCELIVLRDLIKSDL